MSGRQRLPSGRINSSSNNTSVLPSRTLRLSLIPEEVSAASTSRRAEGIVSVGRNLIDYSMSSDRDHPPSSTDSDALPSQREIAHAFASKPWNAPSVQSLTGQLGKRREAHALVVEGRYGDVLTAVGADQDHRIASAVLSRAQEMDRLQRVEKSALSSLVRHAGHTPRHPLPAGDSSSRGKQGTRQFGVVYEHRDCFGKPQFVGHTGGVPEGRFADDAAQHQGVRNLLRYQTGSSEVVWAGSAAPLSVMTTSGEGRSVMQTITQGIVQQRMQAQHLEKLQGPKPYSRHGY